ncbi:hypothetical protein KSS87_017502 [Heliosperma pusillum]|nr:hypothetical protein KSS87_017502 [Heliosperma pusillum]
MEMEEGKICNNETLVATTTETTKMANSSSRMKLLEYAGVLKVLLLCLSMAVAVLVLYYTSTNKFGQSFRSFYGFNFGSSSSVDNHSYDELRKVLKAAATKENTVIITSLNEAWAAPNSIYDLFLESFKLGNNTVKLVDHLVVVAVDDNAYARCKITVSHCYLLKSKQSSQMAKEAVFMTPIYMDMMWQRLAFLHTVLSLGYNFVFTDTDVMWFRSPFEHFVPSSDFQTSTDNFNGRELDKRNAPNNGFLFVWSNTRTIAFYDLWVSSRHDYPGLHEQEVFNRIKNGPSVKRIGLKIRFLDTDYFGGYCTPSRDMNKVCTMHANCCVGLHRKRADLKTTLEDWKIYVHSNQTGSRPSHWRVPKVCRM